MFNQNFKRCIKKTFDTTGDLFVGLSGFCFCDSVVESVKSGLNFENSLDDVNFISLASVGLSMKILSNSFE